MFFFFFFFFLGGGGGGGALNIKVREKERDFRWKEGDFFFIISVLKIIQCS